MNWRVGGYLVGWLVGWFNSQLVGVRVTVRVDVPGHRGAADSDTVSSTSLRLGRTSC